jgi:MFS family permease
MRGRVMSLYGLIGRGVPAIGAIIMGSLAEKFGFQAPVLVGAILLLALWWWARERQSAMSETLELERVD